MRYPESKIKEAILHPDMEIRDRAVSYFGKSFSTDPSIMPLVIEAVEKYGRQDDTYRLIGASRDLPQTEDSIAWVIDELNEEQTDKYENYAYNLSIVLVKADPALLLPRESDILEARHFLADLRKSFTDRLRMLSWDEVTCWQKLEGFCEDCKTKRFISEVNLGYANRIVEALARYGKTCEPRIHEILAVTLDDYTGHPMGWLEPLVVRLAGLIRLESAIPAIVGKLLNDGGDLLNERCAESLAQIGTDAVLHAVDTAFPTAQEHFRLYATEPLEQIHSDLAVEICLKLFGLEKDRMIQRHLAETLLRQFAHEGIEIARSLLVGRELDFEDRGLRHCLLENCTLTLERFPEYDEWRAREKTENEERSRRLKELEGDPRGLLRFALGKLVGDEAADVATRPPLPPFPRPSLPRKPETKHRVGRNDPCPCRSGRKFKQCCMRM